LRTATWTDERFTMCTGSARNGDPLEVGVLGIDGDDPLIIHAMPCRPQYMPHQRSKR
jgi:hypothetical protein